MKEHWKEIQIILKEEGVEHLYHFTDRSNIPSIKQYGGLYSWYTCGQKGITIPHPGGSDVSRKLDSYKGLYDYVRLSFISDHPMAYVARQEGRIIDPVVLFIDCAVATWDGTLFADMNAADNQCHYGETVEDLRRIHFDATRKQYVRKEDPDHRYRQAEVMVKTFIPLKYILNISRL